MIWLERADACGNDDAFTEILPFRCGQAQMTGFQYFEIIHAFVEAKVRAELTALFVEFADEIASQNGGKTADIINIFFGIERGDLSAARTLYKDSLRIFLDLDYKRGVAQILENLACAAADQGEARQALALAGSAAALRHSLGTPLGPSEQAKLEASLEPARKGLAGSEGASAWMEGWATPLEKTVEAALGRDAG